jgi:hypothetical protein
MDLIIAISPYYQGKKFRVDEKGESIWLERLEESGEPTEDYVEVDDDLFQLLVENNQIEGGE